MRTKGFGWIPDVKDSRDYILKLAEPIVYTDAIDLSKSFTWVNDQGSSNSCAVQCTVDALQFLQTQNCKLSFWQQLLRIKTCSISFLSRLFVYYNARYRKEIDEGASIREIFKTLNVHGACSEWMWPHVISRITKKPYFWCYSFAKSRKPVTYESIESASEIRKTLANGFPVIFGMTVFPSFYSIGPDGIMTPPDPEKETGIGGHAMLIVGYKTINDILYFIVRNSWGKDFGKEGYCFIPATVIYNPKLCCDFWAATQMKGI